MPDWRLEISERLEPLMIEPAREAEIVDELSQHLEDYYAESLTGGATPEAAYRAALASWLPSLSGTTLKSLISGCRWR